MAVSDQQIRLKVLLQQRHWQTYRVFRAEYDKAAKQLDPQLIGTWPSRAQFHRWLSGDLKNLPYADHCRILEVMFPGWSADQLFERLSEQQAQELLRLANGRTGDVDTAPATAESTDMTVFADLT